MTVPENVPSTVQLTSVEIFLAHSTLWETAFLSFDIQKLRIKAPQRVPVARAVRGAQHPWPREPPAP